MIKKTFLVLTVLAAILLPTMLHRPKPPAAPPAVVEKSPYYEALDGIFRFPGNRILMRSPIQTGAGTAWVTQDVTPSEKEQPHDLFPVSVFPVSNAIYVPPQNVMDDIHKDLAKALKAIEDRERRLKNLGERDPFNP